jgi:hypothetical protein
MWRERFSINNSRIDGTWPQGAEEGILELSQDGAGMVYEQTTQHPPLHPDQPTPSAGGHVHPTSTSPQATHLPDVLSTDDSTDVVDQWNSPPEQHSDPHAPSASSLHYVGEDTANLLQMCPIGLPFAQWPASTFMPHALRTPDQEMICLPESAAPVDLTQIPVDHTLPSFGPDSFAFTYGGDEAK